MKSRPAVLAMLIAGQVGCGSAHRLLDASLEAGPEVAPRAQAMLSARGACRAVFEERDQPDYALPPAHLALFTGRRSERLAHHVRESGLFMGATPGPFHGVGEPVVRLTIVEEVLAAPRFHFRCGNWLIPVFLGIGVPFIPLIVAGSYRYHAHQPGLRERLTLVVSSEEGEELARLSTLRVIRIEEQEYGCEPPDPILGSPHRAAYDLAFDPGVRLLLSRLMGDGELLARIDRAIAATRQRSCSGCQARHASEEDRHCGACGRAR